MDEKSKELSIIVYSCFRNNDMWEIFSIMFKKYWMDCKYKVYLLTDRYEGEYDYAFDDVICIDATWEEMIKTAIKKIHVPYVMLFMDDYLLYRQVNNCDIENALNILKKERAANIRLTYSSMVKPKNYPENADCKRYVMGTAYSLSTQVGIWDASFLEKVIKPGWSAWDFERIGSMECRNFGQPILQLMKYSFPYVEGVRKGKWLPQGIKTCNQNGISLDFSKRNRMSNIEYFIALFKGKIISINPNIIITLQNKLNQFKKHSIDKR